MGSWYARSFSRKKQDPTFSRWWFQRFFIFTPTWGRFPIWLIFFKGVETTNQFLQLKTMALTWRHLMFFLYWTHDEWHEFSLDFCLPKRWVLRMVYEIPLWWKVTNGTVPLPCKWADWWFVWKGFRWGGEVRCDFGFIYMMLNKHDKQSGFAIANLCCTAICWFDTLKIIHSVHAAKIYTATMGGSPNSAHQSIGPVRVDTSGGWQERSAIFFRSLLHLLLWNNILLMEELHHHWKKITTLIKILR